jgi:hypothetical protein
MKMPTLSVGIGSAKRRRQMGERLCPVRQEGVARRPSDAPAREVLAL